MKGKRKKGGTCLILGGLLLLAAALFLTGYNLLDDPHCRGGCDK